MERVEWLTYPHEVVVSDDPCLEDEEPKRGDHNSTGQTVETELPCLFPFACACIHACHEEDDVERGQCVEYLVAISNVHVVAYDECGP